VHVKSVVHIKLVKSFETGGTCSSGLVVHENIDAYQSGKLVMHVKLVMHGQKNSASDGGDRRARFDTATHSRLELRKLMRTRERRWFVDWLSNDSPSKRLSNNHRPRNLIPLLLPQHNFHNCQCKQHRRTRSSHR
jgi:hypothetical protein